MTFASTVCSECGTPVDQREREWVEWPNTVGWAAVLVALFGMWSIGSTALNTHWPLPGASDEPASTPWTPALSHQFVEAIASGKIHTGDTITSSLMEWRCLHPETTAPGDARLMVGWTPYDGPSGESWSFWECGWPLRWYSEWRRLGYDDIERLSGPRLPTYVVPATRWGLSRLTIEEVMADGVTARTRVYEWTPGLIALVGGYSVGAAGALAWRLATRRCARWWLPLAVCLAAVALAAMTVFRVHVPVPRFGHIPSGTMSYADTGVCATEVASLLGRDDGDEVLARHLLGVSPPPAPGSHLHATFRPDFSLSYDEVEYTLGSAAAFDEHWTLARSVRYRYERPTEEDVPLRIRLPLRPFRAYATGDNIFIEAPVESGADEGDWFILSTTLLLLLTIGLWAVWHIPLMAALLWRRWSTRRRWRRGLCVVCGYPVRVVGVRGG